MNMSVAVKEYPSPDINRREIYRYMSCKEQSTEVDALIDRALALCLDKLCYRICYTELPISFNCGGIDLGFTTTQSRDLAKCLDGCESIILFAATVGLELDRLIKRYSRTEPSLAVCLQAIGAERVESLCDVFCDEIKDAYKVKGMNTRPRFSAGYGDLPLSLQRDIIATLSCPKNIGIALNDSLLMSPSKSVTAIIGIKKVKYENS